jgi:hypothetical protein
MPFLLIATTIVAVPRRRDAHVRGARGQRSATGPTQIRALAANQAVASVFIDAGAMRGGQSRIVFDAERFTKRRCRAFLLISRQ